MSGGWQTTAGSTSATLEAQKEEGRPGWNVTKRRQDWGEVEMPPDSDTMQKTAAGEGRFAVEKAPPSIPPTG